MENDKYRSPADQRSFSFSICHFPFAICHWNAPLKLRMAEGRACRKRNDREHERRDNDKPYHTQLREQLQIVIVRIIDAKRGHGEIELFEGRLVAAQAAAENRIRLDKMHGVFP